MSELAGLILAGGHSRRMGRDKASIAYGDVPQTQACFRLLSKFCKQVYLSNRVEQADLPAHQGMPQIHDAYVEIGPMGGLLSAMERFPGKAWLVLACDMPKVDEAVLQKLVAARAPGSLATVYRLADSDPAGLLEPLCAIYEPAIHPCLQASLEAKKTGLRHILAEIDGNSLLNAISADDEALLISINLLSEWDQPGAIMG